MHQLEVPRHTEPVDAAAVAAAARRAQHLGGRLSLVELEESDLALGR
jgi:hypothetical protein